MNSQTTQPRRSRLAPDPDYSATDLMAPEAKPERPLDAADSRTAEPASRGSVLPALRASAGPDDGRVHVIVTDVHMSFWSMVEFMVKLAFATIPAAIIITFIVLGVLAVAERLMGGR